MCYYKFTRCSPCGPMVCYKYEDCGPPLQCLPRSAFKRNGLQDCQYFQQGSVRYLCRTGPCCSKPCPPRCPPCVRRPPPGKTYKRSDPRLEAEEGGAEKKSEKENQLKRTKSRELRGGIMYYSCHCIKRNGLQHDCRRTGCGGEPSCLVLPDPVCAPSQLARARGLADPAPLAAHLRAQGGGGMVGSSESGTGGGKRFIVCELKGIVPDVSTEKGERCCKCPTSVTKTQGSAGNACVCKLGLNAKPVEVNNYKPTCLCTTSADAGADDFSMFVFTEETIKKILNSFDKKELALKDDDIVIGPGGRPRRAAATKPVTKEPCTRVGCIHWQPPPPCVWDAPCKADCFEAPPGIQPGRNPLTVGRMNMTGGGKHHDGISLASQQPSANMKLLMPECCTGCSASGGSGVGGGAPAAGLPVLVMKLC